jgi:hypothetical protein
VGGRELWLQTRPYSHRAKHLGRHDHLGLVPPVPTEELILLASSREPRNARYGDPLAPRRLPSLLALEIEIARWSTEDTTGDSPAHSRHEYCEPALGCTADPRRTPHARHRCRANDRPRRPPSQGWKTFLRNHADGIASMDLFVVPTISFQLLYRFLILQHHRRVIVWLGVTVHPTTEWIARQLTEAYAWAQTPRYIIRDRDGAYGDVLVRRLRAMGIWDRPIEPRSPWQNGHTERLIGSIRRDCLDHVVVFGERHLRHLLRSYQRYYNDARTHLSLNKDAPALRAVQAVGRIVANPHLGGLHHQYVRM